LRSFKRLDDQASQLECHASVPSFEDFFDAELKALPARGGRSVFGWEANLQSSDSLSANDAF
jgi:hypothetical protein